MSNIDSLTRLIFQLRAPYPGRNEYIAYSAQRIQGSSDALLWIYMRAYGV